MFEKKPEFIADKKMELPALATSKPKEDETEIPEEFVPAEPEAKPVQEKPKEAKPQQPTEAQRAFGEGYSRGKVDGYLQGYAEAANNAMRIAFEQKEVKQGEESAKKA